MIALAGEPAAQAVNRRFLFIARLPLICFTTENGPDLALDCCESRVPMFLGLGVRVSRGSNVGGGGGFRFG